MVSRDRRKLKDTAKKRITAARLKRDSSHTTLKANMEDHGDRMYESLQNWMGNCLKYLRKQLSYLQPLSSSESISATLIEALWSELTLLEKEFTASLRVKKLERDPNLPPDSPLLYSSDELLPFDPNLIVHINKSMLPLVAKICTLMRVLDKLCNEYLEIQETEEEEEEGSGVHESKDASNE